MRVRHQNVLRLSAVSPPSFELGAQRLGEALEGAQVAFSAAAKGRRPNAAPEPAEALLSPSGTMQTVAPRNRSIGV